MSFVEDAPPSSGPGRVETLSRSKLKSVALYLARGSFPPSLSEEVKPPYSAEYLACTGILAARFRQALLAHPGVPRLLKESMVKDGSASISLGKELFQSKLHGCILLLNWFQVLQEAPLGHAFVVAQKLKLWPHLLKLLVSAYGPDQRTFMQTKGFKHRCPLASVIARLHMVPFFSQLESMVPDVHGPNLSMAITVSGAVMKVNKPEHFVPVLRALRDSVRYMGVPLSFVQASMFDSGQSISWNLTGLSALLNTLLGPADNGPELVSLHSDSALSLIQEPAELVCDQSVKYDVDSAEFQTWEHKARRSVKWGWLGSTCISTCSSLQRSFASVSTLLQAGALSLFVLIYFFHFIFSK